MRIPVAAITEAKKKFKELKRSGTLNEAELAELVLLSVDVYHGENSNAEQYDTRRVHRTLIHLDRAIAEILSARWHIDFFGDGDLPISIHNGNSIIEWWHSEDSDADGFIAEFIEQSNQWDLISLWNVRKILEPQLHDYYVAQKELFRNHWASFRTTTSTKIEPTVQQLIFDLCQAWYREVDPSLGLPSSGKGKTNPLIRFLKIILESELKNDVPRVQSLVHFIRTHVRPDIMQENAEGVVTGFDPFEETTPFPS